MFNNNKTVSDAKFNVVSSLWRLPAYYELYEEEKKSSLIEDFPNSTTFRESQILFQTSFTLYFKGNPDSDWEHVDNILYL